MFTDSFKFIVVCINTFVSVSSLVVHGNSLFSHTCNNITLKHFNVVRVLLLTHNIGTSSNTLIQFMEINPSHASMYQLKVVNTIYLKLILTCSTKRDSRWFWSPDEDERAFDHNKHMREGYINRYIINVHDRTVISVRWG